MGQPATYPATARNLRFSLCAENHAAPRGKWLEAAEAASDEPESGFAVRKVGCCKSFCQP
jgi:hypothetical protein